MKSILITGDDGYNSVGVRTLARLLGKKYDVKIAATLNQQSATGGKISLTDKLVWGEETIEDVDALWVDGSPVDAIEVAQGYFDKKFDIVVSGINYGENLSYSLVSSGTFSAAIRAIGVNLADKGIVFSWQTSSNNFEKKHKRSDDISLFLDYPGQEALKITEEIIKNNFYNKELVNVNFPNKPSSNSKLVPISKDITRLWKYPMIIDKNKHIARQSDQTYSDNLETDANTDVGALHAGLITISPINYLT